MTGNPPQMHSMEEAKQVQDGGVVIDGLIVAHQRPQDHAPYFERLMNAGITAANCTACPVNATPMEGVKSLSNWYSLFENHGDTVVLATCARDIAAAKRKGKFAVIMGAQNADIIGGDLEMLSIFERLGMRVIQLSYYGTNLLGEGCGSDTDGGLTAFGVEAVQEMNRRGLLIDVSHCGDRVTMDAIRVSTHPVIASHANPRRLVPLPRNKTDEQILALAEKGGIIGVNAWSPVAEVRKGVRPTVSDLITIVEYLVDLAGVDHVGLGLDTTPFSEQEPFEKWAAQYPSLRPRGGWTRRGVFTNERGEEEPERILEITAGLLDRGHSVASVRKLLGGNFLRVFHEVRGDQHPGVESMSA